MQEIMQETAGNSAGSMENVGSAAYNMGSVRFVSRETACPCDFSGQYRLNGVQEVAGSNPVAPTFARPVGTTSSDWPFSHPGDSFRPTGQSCGQRFNRSVRPDTLPRPLESWLLPPLSGMAERDPLRVCASLKHALWAISNVPRVTCY